MTTKRRRKRITSTVRCTTSNSAANDPDYSVQQTRPPGIYTVSLFASRHPAFTESSLRWLLFNAHENGMEAAVIRVGRRVLIHEERFLEWLDARK
jgi:hypothetical protein